MKNLFFLVFLTVSQVFYSQTETLSVMSLQEYLGYVKAYHPIVRQANLIIAESEANLMKARGGFDPKIEVDYAKKEFKNSEYYDKLNATFKIPTWYGIELKANYEENEGVYLNPENFTPDEGLYNVGISVALAQDLFINPRMATLKQAKLYENQAREDRQLLVNEILYEAALVYFDWLKAYNEKLVFESFLENASIRFEGVKRSFETGENPAIDTLEAGITLKDRKLNLEKARINFVKKTYELSNYLWLNDDTPVELREGIFPDLLTLETVDLAFNVNAFTTETFELDDHPKMRSLDFKYQGLEVDKRLKANKLLPVVDFEYNFLSETPREFDSFNTSNYKSGLFVSIPLFLRKERGDLKLAKLKLQNTQFEIDNTRVSLLNKIQVIEQEIESYVVQDNITQDIVKDYESMLKAEERKFDIGESSLFLVNSRESKLIDAKLKAIDLQNKYFTAKAKLFNALGLVI